MPFNFCTFFQKKQFAEGRLGEMHELTKKLHTSKAGRAVFENG
jgi:uncharacterized protein (DUF3820 family)